MSTYDQHLLDEAPRATRAQLQEGYSVDLLEQPPRRTLSVRSPPPPQTPQPGPVTVPLAPGIAENDSGEKFGSLPAASKGRTSFWRTRNGVITIFVISLIVIGAVVGGAVGGTVTKKSNNNAGTTGFNSSSSISTSTSVTETGTGTETQAIGGGSTPSLRAETATSVSPSVPTPSQSGQTADHIAIES